LVGGILAAVFRLRRLSLYLCLGVQFGQELAIQRRQL
jgi:hypothetical protein